MKTDKELFEEAYEECEAEDIRNVDVTGFIQSCEQKYSITTDEFLKQFERNECEGNPEQQLWYQYAMNAAQPSNSEELIYVIKQRYSEREIIINYAKEKEAAMKIADEQSVPCQVSLINRKSGQVVEELVYLTIW